MSENNAVGRRVDLPEPHLARRRDRVILSACRRATRDLVNGRLRLTMPSGESTVLGRGGSDQTVAAVSLTNFRVFWKALRRGSIGFAEAYMAGDINTPDLGNVFRFFLANKSDLNAAGRGHFKVRLGDKLWHKRRDNSRTGSRRNIAAHYDLGNAFYAPWLDASMTYSSAIYAVANETLEAAQNRKLDAIVAALDLQPGMRVLEVGCGWGALAERIARAGAHVTAITVSAEQLAYAKARIADSGLRDRAAIEFCDYRDVQGSFDRIVSIEMVEAVGEAHWPTYFGMLHDRLKPGGHAVLQAITIHPDRFEAYRAKADFIQRYIFPGGMLPTPEGLGKQASAAKLGFSTIQTFGQGYAHTLAAWRERFEAAWPALSPLGFDERFRRMWLYYLIYCEVGFEQGATDVGLYKFARAS
jgi:cyclopropane-fatty-acyl-phospholipid synthase